MAGCKQKGLLAFEWAALIYIAVTLVLIAVLWQKLVSPLTMVQGRVAVVVMTLALWAVYRWRPCRLTMLLRVVGQMAWLGWWYPDTYELNRVLPNLDHLFAEAEQWVFGCQPALLFSWQWPQPILSEVLTLGYVSYYPLIAAVVLYYFLRRYAEFTHCVFIIMGSFFLFYIIFDLLPVAGPQFYYEAVGIKEIAQGHFANVGMWFLDHQNSLPSPGYSDGLFYHLLQQAHEAGERPTAAFPSSHVGITTVLLCLAWHARSRWLFFTMLPLGILMFFATFYIQAHYVIDAIAGIFTGLLFYYLLSRVADFSTKNRKIIRR